MKLPPPLPHKLGNSEYLGWRMDGMEWEPHRVSDNLRLRVSKIGLDFFLFLRTSLRSLSFPRENFVLLLGRSKFILLFPRIPAGGKILMQPSPVPPPPGMPINSNVCLHSLASPGRGGGFGDREKKDVRIRIYNRGKKDASLNILDATKTNRASRKVSN